MTVANRTTERDDRSPGPQKTSFDPLRDKVIAPADAWRIGDGRRKVVEVIPSVMLHWPQGAKDRRDLVKAWHSHAMAEIHRAKISFRLMAVLKDFVHWRTGMIFPTNATLAECAGQCTERTVSDLLGKYEDLGIVRLRFGWRKGRTGKWLQTRIIFMTLPKQIGFPMKFPSAPDEDDDVQIRVEDGVLGELIREGAVRVEDGVLGGVEDGVLSTYEGTSESYSRGGEDAV